MTFLCAKYHQISACSNFSWPHLAFKDIGARFLARIISHYSRNLDKPVNVLVATSGDSGWSCGERFPQSARCQSVRSLPGEGLSAKQRHQFTSLGDNVIPIEVLGTFDDCQRLVKEAFVDQDLRRKLNITSANSINICRLLPQMFYYFSMPTVSSSAGSQTGSTAMEWYFQCLAAISETLPPVFWPERWDFR